MLIKVYRYDSENGKGHYYDEFQVPAKIDWTVMDVLDYIALHFDSSIAYYKHSACDHGICARCALKVNGKTTLACTCVVGNESELLLEPKNDKIVRDLVTL